MAQNETGRRPVVAIVGLDPVAISLGLALQAVKTRYELVGHDADAERVKTAMQAGAVDRTSLGLAQLAGSADLVVLGGSVSDALVALEIAAPNLRPGALVTGIHAVQRPLLEAAARWVPDTASFIAGHPVVAVAGAPDAAVFAGATWCLAPSPTAAEQSLRVLSQLVQAVGAQPFFVDADEHDALMVGVGALPAIVAAALLRLLAASPSAGDLKRLAAPDVARMLAAAGQLEAHASALRDRQQPVLAFLDGVLDEIGAIRAAVAAGDEETLSRLHADTHAAHQAWAEADQPAPSSDALRDLSARRSMLDTLIGRRG
jgi:prephenate dehydrogenase